MCACVLERDRKMGRDEQQGNDREESKQFSSRRAFLPKCRLFELKLCLCHHGYFFHCCVQTHDEKRLKEKAFVLTSGVRMDAVYLGEEGKATEACVYESCFSRKAELMG